MLNHRSLLKSVIDFSGDEKERAYIIDNFNILVSSNIAFKDEHAKIYDFIKEHSGKFVDVPSSLSTIVLKYMVVEPRLIGAFCVKV